MIGDIKVLVPNQTDAVEIARALVRAANSVSLDPDIHDIEKTAITNTLCMVRDRIAVEGSVTYAD